MTRPQPAAIVEKCHGSHAQGMAAWRVLRPRSGLWLATACLPDGYGRAACVSLRQCFPAFTRRNRTAITDMRMGSTIQYLQSSQRGLPLPQVDSLSRVEGCHRCAGGGSLRDCGMTIASCSCAAAVFRTCWWWFMPSSFLHAVPDHRHVCSGGCQSTVQRAVWRS